MVVTSHNSSWKTINLLMIKTKCTAESTHVMLIPKKCVVMTKEVMRNELYYPGIKCDQHKKEEK
jgi:hypothetical protein